MTRRRLLAVASVWLFFSVALLGTDADPAIPVLAGLVAVLAAAIFVVADVALSAVPVDWARGTRSRERAVETDQRVTKLRRDARAAINMDSRAIESTLITLVDDALLDRCGIDRSLDPQAADRVLSEPLKQLTGGSWRRLGSTRDVQRLLTDIEAI